MKNTVSLKENRDFKRLYARGKSTADFCLAVYAIKKKPGLNRLGITVSVKVGCAVVRNRVRRRIKEAYRLNEHRFLNGMDIVIVARIKAAEVNYFQIEKSVVNLIKKIEKQ